MGYRWAIVAIGMLATVQPNWAQPGGGQRNPGGPRNPQGQRNQDEAIRRLEREVADLKSEIRKLQEANRASSDRRGGPPARNMQRGGPGGFGGGFDQGYAGGGFARGFGGGGFGGGFGGNAWGRGFGPGFGPGPMGFRGQFGPPRGNQFYGRPGFRPGQWDNARQRPGQFRGNGRRGPDGPPRMNRDEPPARNQRRPGDERRPGFDGPPRNRDDNSSARPDTNRPGPGGNRPNQDRRPPRPE